MDYIQSYIDTFINRSDCWYRQVVRPDGGVDYFRQHSPVTKGLVNLHLYGSYNDDTDTLTASWSATDHDGYSKWCCWDDDTNTGAAEAIVKLLKQWGLRPVRESVREGRGGHVWLFFDRKIHADNLLAIKRYAIRRAKLSIDIEFFPKSADKHSQVRGPLGIHRKIAPAVRGYFDGVKHNVLAQLKYIANDLPRSNADWLEATAHAVLNEERIQEAQLYQTRKRAYRPSESILHLVPHTRRMGGEYAAPCPLCRAEGHDRSGDNLRISTDGMIWCCVFNGPGQAHKGRAIYKELERLVVGA